MSDEFGWKGILQDAVDAMLDTLAEREAMVYDIMLPAILDVEAPEVRKQFYSLLDMDQVKETSPELWARLSNDALSLAEKQQKKTNDLAPGMQDAGANALDKLSELEAKQDAAFRYQVTQRPIMGLREKGAPQLSTQAQGLDTSLPLGMLGRRVA